MNFSRGNALAVGGVSALALAVAATPVSAGGFAPKEQSAYFFGTAYAGAAAGGVLSSMFWNPAALGQFDGVNSDSNYTLIMPNTEITVTGGTALGLGADRTSGDIGDTAILPASYFSYQLNEKIVVGMSVNAPFGLTTDPDFGYVGSPFHRESKIATYNFSPTVAYRLTPGVIVAAGLQVEYIDAQLRSAFPALGGASGPTAAIKGDDVGFGFTAGIMLNPMQGTTIGLGFRSKVEHDLEGTFHIASVPGENQISADVDLPEMVTLSFRQDLMPTWTLLGTVEWMNWSRVPRLQVFCDAPGPPACAGAGIPLPGGTLPLGWDDGWMFSLGLEKRYNEVLTFRGGIGYEISPIDDPTGRTLRVPDADRVWLTVGASYVYSEWTTIDFSYGHLFVEDSTTVQGELPLTLVGDVESSADAISVGVRSKLDWLFSGG